MPFISVHRSAGPDRIRLVVADASQPIRQTLRPDGTFAERETDVVYEREVPDGAAVLARVEELLASSRVPDAPGTFTCPAPLAVQAIGHATEGLWPTRRLQCPSCRKPFVVPHGERRRMYLACPHCHNPLLNPAWDSA